MRTLQSLVLAAATVGLTACAGGGVYYSRRPVPPPPPMYRGVVGRAPGPGFVWVDGYYDWGGRDYRWVQGRWMRPPHPRAVWEPGHWMHRGNREIWIAGRWRR